jgi:hypothetical protein
MLDVGHSMNASSLFILEHCQELFHRPGQDFVLPVNHAERTVEGRVVKI